MTRKRRNDEELFYKSIIKELGIHFHHYLKYPGEKITFHNVELTPPYDEKRMDIGYDVDSKVFYNIEHQSSPVYESKMKDIYKYHIYCEVEHNMDVKTVILSTSNPKYGIKELDIPHNITFNPEFIFLKEKKVSKVLSTIEKKLESNETLNECEAIDLVLIPDMDIDLEISLENLFRDVCTLLMKSNIPNDEFKLKLINCEKRMLERFFEKELLEEFKNMLYIKAEDVGLEPNVTGFEEKLEMTINLAVRENSLDIAERLLKDGISIDKTAKLTDLPVEKIQRLFNSLK